MSSCECPKLQRAECLGWGRGMLLCWGIGGLAVAAAGASEHAPGPCCWLQGELLTHCCSHYCLQQLEGSGDFFILKEENAM